VSLGVTSAAKASDDAGVHIGQRVDNAPGEKLLFIAHETLLAVRVDGLANVR